MTSYIIGSVVDWNTWEKQNNAQCIDCAEGCLLDNVVYSTKNGIAFFFEVYATSNSSNYEFIFFRNKETKNNDFYDECWTRLDSLRAPEE